MDKITIHDKVFFKVFEREDIERAIGALAERLNRDYGSCSEPPLFLSVLNGAFMFTAELLKRIEFASEVTFIKLASYSDLNSCGNVCELLGLDRNLEGRDVIVLEDIVDTGRTIVKLNEMLHALKPRSVEYAALFYKPETYDKPIPINYYAVELRRSFIIGYGLDYNQLGRNLPDIYEYRG